MKVTCSLRLEVGKRSGTEVMAYLERLLEEMTTQNHADSWMLTNWRET